MTNFISILENRLEYLEDHERDHSINELIHLGILSSNEIFDFYSNIIQIINNKKPMNLINILNFKNLNSSINSIRESLSNDTYLPDNNLFGIIRGCDYSFKLHNNTINITLIVPILSYENTFSTYKMVPIPFVGEGGGLSRLSFKHDIFLANPFLNANVQILPLEKSVLLSTFFMILINANWMFSSKILPIHADENHYQLHSQLPDLETIPFTRQLLSPWN